MEYDTPPVLKYLDFEEDEIKKAVKEKGLLLIDMHMGNRCNLHCPGCYRNAGRSFAEELTIDECENILRQARALGAKTWVVTGSGEPFLDPKLQPLIEFAGWLNMGVVIFTNNTLITSDLAHWLSVEEVSIVAKLNSFKPDIQDFIVGKPGAHTAIYRGLKNLVDYGFNKPQPSKLGIDTVIVRQNYKEIPDIFRYCRNLNIVPYITTELPGGRGKENAEVLDVSVQELKEMFFRLREIDHEYGFDWQPHPPIVAGGSCRKILYQLFVGPTGEIGVCPGLNISLGNVRETSLAEALQTELVKKIRQPEKFYQPCPICKQENRNCTGGCLLSKSSAGDLFSVDPQCCW